MTGKRLKASVIIDLNGNLSRRSRQYSNQINVLSRSGQSSLRALRMEVVRVSGAIDRMGSLSTRTFRMLSAGALGIAGVGYTANKLFIGAAAQREQQIIAMNSLYHGDKARAQAMMAWAKQNAKETTWGLGGVLQEIRTSTAFGMTDAQVKQFITMLQNQGAMHGWDLPTAQGASLQFKQMFARQQITAADANLLTGYRLSVVAGYCPGLRDRHQCSRTGTGRCCNRFSGRYAVLCLADRKRWHCGGNRRDGSCNRCHR